MGLYTYHISYKDAYFKEFHYSELFMQGVYPALSYYVPVVGYNRYYYRIRAFLKKQNRFK